VPKPVPTPVPTPIPTPIPTPKPPAPAPCTITTRTLLPAPDGTANTRAVVGVGEEVEMTCSVPAVFAATAGTIRVVNPSQIIWTAPDVPTPAVITATPASAPPCNVSMAVIKPTANLQTVARALVYSRGLAGSGFVGNAVVQPLSVAFQALDIREEQVLSTATGYYDVVLHWNRKAHPQGSPIPVAADNSAGQDTVGSVPPGTPPPFSDGRFHWPIPQSYRVRGGPFRNYSTADHVQEMKDTTGEETTSKEGAIRPRRP
jgi:hypothetical protein